MFAELHYLLRSKLDGAYLVAHLDRSSEAKEDQTTDPGYLLLFREHYDALSYVNTHGADVANRFAVESISGKQLENLIQRWGFLGIGIVQDPLLPRIEFLTRQ